LINFRGDIINEKTIMIEGTGDRKKAFEAASEAALKILEGLGFETTICH
jgi:hypothetical protein